MASKILDDPDGLYLENDDSLDEVDATKIFKVTDVEAIAPNFARDVAKNAPWKRQRTNRSRSVGIFLHLQLWSLCLGGLKCHEIWMFVCCR